MTADRWAQIEAIVIDALERPASVRSAYLDDACAGDEALRREVEALIGYDSAGESFLEQPALEEAARITAADESAAATDCHIAGYAMSSLLGAGGMGEVYRARDVRLERDVAIKVVPAVQGDHSSATRFEEEARAASGLNHPNIVTIYSVGSHDDVAYIVMELVSGRTLRAVLADGPLPVSLTLDVAAQMADGLAAAHAAGVVHRDLKPENVMLTPGGLVKILDFGIAKRERGFSIAGSVQVRVDASPTSTFSGTAGYMAPEQAEGRSVDHRADQFSFGAIVYEMLSGRRAFERDSKAAATGAIIGHELEPIARLQGQPALSLWRIVERCLSSDPGARYSNTLDLARDLHGVRDESVFHARRSQMTRRRALWLGGAAMLGVAGGTAWMQLRGPTIRSLAVLPFANPLNDDDTEYLCVGITKMLIRQLNLVSALKVSSDSTVFQLKGIANDPRTVARQLGVDAVLNGSVTRRGDRARVEVELADADGNRVWGDPFDRSEADVLAIQNEIVSAIIESGLRIDLSDDDRRALNGALTHDPEAFRLFLQAVHHLRFETEKDYLASRELLTKAVTRDGTFALAYLTLGSTYSVMAIDGFAAPHVAWKKSREYVDLALKHDPSLPDAHAERAIEAFFYGWDWTRSEHEWKTALASPRGELQAELLSAYVLQQWALGRPEEGLRFAQAARAADRLSLGLAVREADMLAKTGRLTEAADLYTRLINEWPTDRRANVGLAEVRRAEGRFDDAIDLLREAYPSEDDPSLEELFAVARGRDGYRDLERAFAERELMTLQQRSESGGGYVSPLDLARAFARLGETTKAFSYFGPAFEHRSPGLVFLKVDRVWNGMRNDTRFTDAVQRVGFT